MCTLRTDAFDDILCLFHYETCRKRDGGDADISETKGAMAKATGEVDMTMTMARVVEVTDTVLLRAGAVVDAMQ